MMKQMFITKCMSFTFLIIAVIALTLSGCSAVNIKGNGGKQTASSEDTENISVESGFTTEGDKTYYYDKEGNLVKGLVELDGKKYYFDDDTGEQIKGFEKLDTETMTQSAEGDTYYFKMDTGEMIFGMKAVGKNVYYLDPESGIMQTGWIEANGKMYYFAKDGKRQTGLVELDGKKYFFDEESGKLRHGFINLNSDNMSEAENGDTYYFKMDTGEMIFGLKVVGEDIYYLDPESGIMQTGWKKVKDNEYYFSPETGAALKGEQEIDGETYVFDEKGVLQSE